MSYQMPDTFSTYRRKSDGLEVIVGAATGSTGMSTVTCSRKDGSGHRWHVRLENFWKKYEPKETQ